MIKIVVIEDLPIILEGIKVLINQIDDFEVVAEYSNGKDFVDNISLYRDEIILTDIDMPVMDGITATKLAIAAHPDLKVIALSMYNDHKYYYDMITAGAKGFVLKQSSVEELEVAIREVYQGGHFFSKDLMYSVIVGMQKDKEQIENEKKELLKLSERDVKMLKYICQGCSNKELAEKLYLSVKTIESNKAKLMQKTKTKNNAGLIIWAIKNNIVNI